MVFVPLTTPHRRLLGALGMSGTPGTVYCDDDISFLRLICPVGFGFPGAHPLGKQRGRDLVKIEHALRLRLTLIVDVEKSMSCLFIVPYF